MGHPQVAAVTLLSPHTSASDMLALAAAVERQATHPVARALVAAAEADQQHKGSTSGHATSTTSSSSSSSSRIHGAIHHDHSQRYHVEPGSFIQEPGSGAMAVVGGTTVAVGTLEWVTRQGAALSGAGAAQLDRHQSAVAAATTAVPPGDTTTTTSSSSGSGSGLITDPAQDVETGHLRQGSVHSQPSSSSSRSSSGNGTLTASFQGQPLTGHTQVYISVGKAVVGVVDVADQIRPDAVATISELQSKGVDTIMLSGDRREAAEAVAAAVGIPADAVHAGIKPAGKAALVEHLKAKGRKVAMVGDGINDTAALAAANVGMAMAEGVDAASDVSKIVLMGGNLHQVAEALELSKRTLAKIHQNLGWAFCYNIVGIPLAAGALLPKMGIALTPSISGALMGVSSLAVMGNSLLLQWEMRKSKSPVVAATQSTTGAAAAVAAGGSGYKKQQQQQQEEEQQLVGVGLGSKTRQQDGAKVLGVLERQEAAAVDAGA